MSAVDNNIQVELEKRINEVYPEYIKISPEISYSSSSENNVRYNAEVKFYFPENTGTSYWEYQNQSYKYVWAMVRDWED